MNPSPPSDATAHPLHGSLTVVGLGASAGGLGALRAFFESVPPDSGMAYVVITHLDPERKSEMAELIQNRASIPVQQATEALQLEPDHAYVIPPNRELRLEGEKLRLAERSERGLHAPIDLFFRTLAAACGSRAVGVVLSGTGSDGTSGLGFIKEAGGLTVAQEPDDAEYDAMPRSAISAGHVDLVLPAWEIAGELLRLQGAGLGPSGEPAALPDAEDADESEDVEALIRRIVAHLRSRTGHDFGLYKRATVGRRIERRVALSSATSLSEYLELLRGDRGEVQLLLRDLMVSVSSFFRDPEAYGVLERDVIPGLFEGKGASDWVRVWVPGCATGEEAYSVAFLLREHASTLDEPPSIQLFATDIDEDALAFARTGRYPSAIAADVSPERLERFFTQDEEEDGYRVREDLRKMVLIAKHDVLRDPPFSDLDLITFRNVLIYLQPEAQAHALAIFHYALRPDGAFFLGASESVNAVDGLFTPIDKKYRIFRRVDPGPGFRLPLGRRWGKSHVPAAPGSEGPGAKQGPGTLRDRAALASPAADLHLRLLEAYAPPSMVVNREREIVHLSPRAGEYLRVAGGEPSLDAVELAPGELQLELRTALYQAFEKGRATRRSLELEVTGGRRRVHLVVRPLKSSGEEVDGLPVPSDFALVVFEEHGGPAEEGAESTAGEEDAAESDSELARTRTELREVVEERQATIEELQAAVEELQSINEEQQATGEELETSREELQSTNEELTTVNEEYRGVIAELNQVNADLRNLMDATEIGTVFLDRELRVRRFTPAITPLINLVDSDRGRPLSDLSHRLQHPGLLEDAGTVLRTLETIEREVEGEDGDWYTLRIIPYRSLEDRIDGVVVTFFEITTQKQVESEMREAVRLLEVERARLAELVEHLPAAAMVVEASSGLILSANERLRELLHDDFLSPDSPDAHRLMELASHPDGTPFRAEEWPVSRTARDGEVVRDLEITFRLPDEPPSTFLVSSAPLSPPDGGVDSVIVTLIDISRRLEMEEELRAAKRAAEAADVAKSAFVATLSHELRTPLTAILGYAELLLLQDSLGESESQRVERIRLAANHLTFMLGELLQFGILEEGEVSARTAAFDARGIAEEAAGMLEPEAAEKGLALRLEFPDQPVELMSDGEKIRQILLSLLGNAVKFTTEGEVRLSLHTDEGHAVFGVHDTGIGMTPEDRDRVFERFWQAGNSTPGAGSGIGLWVARRLSRLLGGDVTVESEPGVGSTFTLRLPHDIGDA